VPLHDRGKVLVRSMPRLASGADSDVEIEHPEVQAELFGWKLSDSTMFRDFRELRTLTATDRIERLLVLSLSNNRVPFSWT
jgi:hypothetical protein